MVRNKKLMDQYNRPVRERKLLKLPGTSIDEARGKFCIRSIDGGGGLGILTYKARHSGFERQNYFLPSRTKSYKLS